MILIIHPSVGLHEVRNVSVIFYRRQNILLFAKREKYFLWLIFTLTQISGMSSAAMYLIRKENLIIRFIQSADRYNEVTFS